MRDGLGSRTGPGSPPAPTPTILSKAVFIEEESLPHYRPQDWYPAKIGETLHGRYRIAVKLGYGSFSTVWLARDLRAYVLSTLSLSEALFCDCSVLTLSERWWKKCPFVVLKIITSGDGEESTAGTELEISRSIAKAKPTSEGRQYLRTAISSFKVNTPHETHMVLVYEPMRETLADLQLSYPNNRFPVHLLKTYVEMILTGLDDLHSQCKIIHTGKPHCLLPPPPRENKACKASQLTFYHFVDLKPDNILVGIESKEVIWELVKAEAKDPSPRKEVGGGKTIHTRRAFGPMRSAPRAPKIADFGLSVHGDVEEPYYHTIQPEIYRAPEVVLRAGWTYSADIWNLGVVVSFFPHCAHLITTLFFKPPYLFFFLKSPGRENKKTHKTPKN